MWIREQRGAVHLVLGDGSRIEGRFDLGADAVTFLGREQVPGETLVSTVHDRAGASLAGGHDVNGDGLDDFLVGAPGDATGDLTGGRAYLVFGVSSIP